MNLPLSEIAAEACFLQVTYCKQVFKIKVKYVILNVINYAHTPFVFIALPRMTNRFVQYMEIHGSLSIAHLQGVRGQCLRTHTPTG